MALLSKLAVPVGYTSRSRQETSPAQRTAFTVW